MTLTVSYFIFGPIVVTGGFWLLLLIGVVWAPFAAYLMHRAARRRGLDSPRYAIAGAAYSLFLLFPWFLAMATLHGRRFPIGPILFFLYLVWLLGPMGATFAIYTVRSGISQAFSEPVITLQFALVSVVALIVMAFAWIGSLVHVLRLDLTYTRSDHLLEYRYVMPFAFASASAVAFLTIVRLW